VASRTGILAGAALAVLAAFLVIVPAAAAAPAYVFADSGLAQVRPRSLHLISNENLYRLHWARWGGARAAGAGMDSSNGPSAGHSAENPVTVELRNRRRCFSGSGLLVYTTVRVHFTGGVPYAGEPSVISYSYGCPPVLYPFQSSFVLDGVSLYQSPAAVTSVVGPPRHVRPVRGVRVCSGRGLQYAESAGLTVTFARLRPGRRGDLCQGRHNTYQVVSARTTNPQDRLPNGIGVGSAYGDFLRKFRLSPKDNGCSAGTAPIDRHGNTDCEYVGRLAHGNFTYNNAFVFRHYRIVSISIFAQ